MKRRNMRTCITALLAWLAASAFTVSAESGPVAAGRFHTCALTTEGAVQCWGFNDSGQLGDGTTTQRLTPVPVTGSSTGVRAIAAGSSHTCALTTAGAVRCWGRNFEGQLGDGTTTQRLAPAPVSGLSSGVQAVVAGFHHACALTTAGAVQCWGDNGFGQLGDGTITQRETPVPVTGLGSGVQAIAAGTIHTCALTAAGAVQCWGSNDFGQLGDDTTTQRLTPVPVTGLSTGVRAIAAGSSHTCALTTAGAVQCWGQNLGGQLGDGTTMQRLTPVPVTDLSDGAQAIAAGTFHTCALTTTGAVRCWGRNFEGELGDGTTMDRLTPNPVTGLGGEVQVIATGDFHTCALTAAGAVQCWGFNGNGQLGDGTSTQRLTPATVQFATGFGSGAAPLPGVTLTAPSPIQQDLTGNDVAVSDSALAVAVPGREMVLVFNRNTAGTYDPSSSVKGGVGSQNVGNAWGSKPAAVLTARTGAKAIGDKFGESLAFSPDGSMIAVGAPLANGGVGEIQVFRRGGTSWSGALSGGTVVAPTPTSGVSPMGFGASVAIDDNGNLVVGAPGSSVNGMADAGTAYAFRDTGTIVANGTALMSSAVQAAGAFGTAVSVDDGTIAVGAPSEDGAEADAGAAYVFPPIAAGGGGGFQPTQTLACAGSGGIGDKFACGAAIAIHNGRVIVGAPGADSVEGSDSGAAQVFEPGISLTPRAVLRPMDGIDQRAGASVAITDDAVVIGAPTASITRTGQGRAFVYAIPDASFSGEVQPDATLGSPANGEDSYGTSLAVSRRNLVIGAPTAQVYDDTAAAQVVAAGRADTYVFDRILKAGFE